MALLMFAALGWVALTAATPEETQAYEVAKRTFKLGAFEAADAEFASFLCGYPQSEFAAEAVLLQAQSRLQRGDAAGVVELLQAGLAKAGAWAPAYRYWLGEAYLLLHRHPEAAQAGEALLVDAGAREYAGRAAYIAASARFALRDYRRVTELLDPTAMSAAGATNLPSELAFRGGLLLAESHFNLRQYEPAKGCLTDLGQTALPAALEWQRRYLLAQTLSATKEFPAATEQARWLVEAAKQAQDLERGAQASALLGDLLRSQGQLGPAIERYELNLATNLAPSWRRQAIDRIVDLTVQQNRPAEAKHRLETFLRSEPPGESAFDGLRLMLGELWLREFHLAQATNGAASTNLLNLARQQFSQVVANGTPELLPRAHLNLGWCLWEEVQRGASTNLLRDGEAAFSKAAAGLPPSLDQARARVKLADCQALLGNLTGAASNYVAAVNAYQDDPKARSEVLDLCLCQLVRTSIALQDFNAASNAVAKILAWYPKTLSGERAVLTFGQELNRQQQTIRARQVLGEFAERFPGSSLAAEAQLAVASSYVRERSWPPAAQSYEAWLARYTNHPARAAAEFDRAWATYLAGDETNAFRHFTNFVSVHPTNALVLLAENWLGDFYRNRDLYDLAEDKYQRVFQNTNWPPSELSFRAHLMAGRMAFARRNLKDARGYLTNLVNQVTLHTNLAAELQPEAWLLLGDAILHQFLADPARPAGVAAEAIAAFGRVTQEFPSNRLAAAAWGRMGDCHLQLAATDPKQYERAALAYSNVVGSIVAHLTNRCQAQVGLGLVREKQAALAQGAERSALLAEALRHYLGVVTGKGLKVGEPADPFWLKEATLAAGRLAEELQQWDLAARLYSEANTRIPLLKALWEGRLRAIQTNRPPPSARP